MSASSPAPLFASLLGERFHGLPPSVRTVHGGGGRREYTGVAEVARGSGWITGFCARVAGLPPPHRGCFRIVIDDAATGERWSRHFGRTGMHSRLWSERGRLHERLGPITFAFALDATDSGLEWRMERARFLVVPLPLRWLGGVRARAFDHAGRYGFDVSVALPVIGRLIHYRGWLDVG